MNSSTESVIELLSSQWRHSGIHAGDTVLIHSSALRTMQRIRSMLPDGKPDITILLRSFQDAVGKEGTLLFPLFNFSFTSGTPFDIRSTPSRMGALTEAARKDSQSVRTGHPVYSFAVIGRHATMFRDLDNRSAYGADSPFAKLRELDGRIASLDLSDQNSMTFYHHVEEMNAVPYRYMKEFSGAYTDACGITTTRTYTIYVRDLERGVVTHVDPTGEKMWQAGLYSGDRPLEESGLRVISANAMYGFVDQLIKDGSALGSLYEIRPA